MSMQFLKENLEHVDSVLVQDYEFILSQIETKSYNNMCKAKNNSIFLVFII
jgi:hypothetical protein